MIHSIIDALANKNKVIIVHGNADMDAIGSAYAILRGFGNADIFAPGGVDKTVRIVIDKMRIPVCSECDISDYEQVVVVDTSSPNQLDMHQTLPYSTIVIDHHTPTGEWKNYTFICDSNRKSCCEMVKDILDCAKIFIERDVGLVLLGGMLTDSGNLQLADHNLILSFGDLMRRCCVDMNEVINLVKTPISISEKIAVLKAMSHIRFDHFESFIVAVSYGSSFEASSCNAIISAGADVAFVGSQRKNEFRLSSRATYQAICQGIHLGNMMREIGIETMSNGGGHCGAAGLTGIGDVEAMLSICMGKTMDILRDIKSINN